MAGKLRSLFACAISVMEPGGAAAVESSWSALNSATAAEESELMAQFIASHSLSNEQDDEPSLVMQSLFWSDHTIESCYGSQEINTNTYYWPMESGCNFSSCSYSNKQASDYECCYNSMESNMISAIELRSEPVVFYMKEEENANTSHRFDCRLSVKDCEGAGEPGTHDIKKLKGKRKIQVCEPAVIESPAVSPKKKARSSSQAGKGSKRLNSKKSEKEAGNTSPAVQSSSSCSSEDETNVSKEFTSMSPKDSASLNSNGKTRAGRGSATDPQSLYARKRRERINERLRILQNLVPNGTKVDISTMLEEAVQYVKFLQVQIKLLSSDELWMYAPIAYGMNIGIDLKITPS